MMASGYAVRQSRGALAQISRRNGQQYTKDAFR